MDYLARRVLACEWLADEPRNTSLAHRGRLENLHNVQRELDVVLRCLGEHNTRHAADEDAQLDALGQGQTTTTAAK